MGSACGADATVDAVADTATTAVDAATTSSSAASTTTDPTSTAGDTATTETTATQVPAAAAPTGDVLVVSFNSGDEYEVTGDCSPGGAGFSAADGQEIVSYDGTDALSVAISFTDPAGSTWSAVTASSSAVGEAGFIVFATLTDGSTTDDAYLDVICS